MLTTTSSIQIDEEDEIDQIDTVLNRFYNRSDVNYYYKLKAEHKEQKLKLQKIKEHNKQVKNSQQTFN